MTGLSAAALQRGVLGLGAALMAAWLALQWQAGRPGLGLLGALLLAGTQAGVLGLEMLLAAWVARRRGEVPAGARRRLAAWWAELRCSSRSFGWQQPFRAARWPDRLDGAAGRRGIVLVHGYACNRALWQPWLPALQAAGVPFLAPSFGPVLAPIEAYVAQLDAAVRRMTAATGQAPLLVCHSMGGLVARAWLRGAIAAEGPAALQRIHRVLTIGSPHQGTWLARWGRGASARQMRCDSAWLQALAASETAALRARLYCVYSDCDNVVFPARTARLDGAPELLLPGLAHLQLLQAPALPALALQLAAAADADPGLPDNPSALRRPDR